MSDEGIARTLSALPCISLHRNTINIHYIIKNALFSICCLLLVFKMPMHETVLSLV
jgi:hypothetical protein